MTDKDEGESPDDTDYKFILSRERYKQDKGRTVADAISIRIKKLRRSNKVMYRNSVY